MLYDALKRLTKQSILYALGPALHKAVGIALMPVVTVWIGTTEDMGVFELASMTLVIAGQLLGLNILSGMTRYYYDYERDERGEVVTTTLLLLMASTGLGLVAAFVFARPASLALFRSEEHADAVVALGAILFCQAVGLVGLRYLQVLQRSVAYGLLTTVKLLTEVGFKVWFMGFLGLTYMGMLYSVLVGEALLAVGTVLVLARSIGMRFSVAKARQLLRFTYPLIPSGLCMFALHSIDRYVIAWHYDGTSEAGLYGIGYRFGSIVNLVVLEAFGLIWFPYVYSLRDRAQVREVSRAVLTYFCLLMTAASLAAGLFATEIVQLMTEGKFWPSAEVVPVVLLGYVFWGAYQVASTTFYVEERTGIVSGVVALAAAVNLGLNLVLVPSLGTMGAAWATLITFACLAALSWGISERLFPTGFELGRVALPAGLAVGLYGVSRLLPDAFERYGVTSWRGHWITFPVPTARTLAVVAAKGGLLVAFPVLLAALGFLSRRERSKIRDIVSMLSARLR
jgi:O-antigen/teichoic acid export membrane protein